MRDRANNNLMTKINSVAKLLACVTGICRNEVLELSKAWPVLGSVRGIRVNEERQTRHAFPNTVCPIDSSEVKILK